jgi:hypothetical protein
MFDFIYILFKYLQVAGTDEYMEDSLAGQGFSTFPPPIKLTARI